MVSEEKLKEDYVYESVKNQSFALYDNNKAYPLYMIKFKENLSYY